MDTMNSQFLGWWRQFVTNIPLLQISDEGIKGRGAELGDAERFVQLENSLGRLFPYMSPSPTFRTRLKQALLAEHQRRLAHRETGPVSQESSISWRWSLAATTIPLVIGALAFFWRRSQRPSEQLVSLTRGQ